MAYGQRIEEVDFEGFEQQDTPINFFVLMMALSELPSLR
jgi:hypothetical protein